MTVVDVIASRLFHDDPIAAVKYLAIAKEMRIGVADINNINVKRIDC